MPKMVRYIGKLGMLGCHIGNIMGCGVSILGGAVIVHPKPLTLTIQMSIGFNSSLAPNAPLTYHLMGQPHKYPLVLLK